MNQYKNIIPYLTLLVGILLIIVSSSNFIKSIELYKIFRIERDFNGCIFGAQHYLPFYEFIISMILMIYGVILIKRINVLFKILIYLSLSFALYYSLGSIISMIYCIISNCSIIDYKILEFSGVLFFTLIISEYFKYNWKEEINKINKPLLILIMLLIFIINKSLNLL